MDDLRWILLIIALVIVAGIYFLSRGRKKVQRTMPLDAANDMPSFSAEKQLNDDWSHGVGPVKVVSSAVDTSADINIDKLSLGDLDDQILPNPSISVSDISTKQIPDEMPASAPEDSLESGAKNRSKNPSETSPTALPNNEPNRAIDGTGDDKKADAQNSNHSSSPDETDAAIDDVISIYVLAEKSELIKGEKILSASYALHMEFGEMKIFHRHEETGKHDIQFSMANIMEPGWFHVEKMHEMQTQGISFFMQVNLVEDPSKVLDDMLVCAHSMSKMLGATLCNAGRKPLDENSTNELRHKVQHLAQLKLQAK